MIKGLIIVAHPDDDAIFAGPIQIANPWISWNIVCMTYQNQDFRAKELLLWQKKLTSKTIHFLGFPDDPNDLLFKKSSFSVQEVIKSIAELSMQPDFVVTHNQLGEYGHPHHITLNQAVKQVYQTLPIIFFAHYLNTFDFRIEVPSFYENCISAFSSQAEVIKKHHIRCQCCVSGQYKYYNSRMDDTSRSQTRSDNSILL